MLNSIDRITWRNGYKLNGAPAHREEIEPILKVGALLRCRSGNNTSRARPRCANSIYRRSSTRTRADR